jgi:hypothetical protein
LNGVNYGDFVNCFGEGGLELQEAAGISGGDDVGSERADEGCFANA